MVEPTVEQAAALNEQGACAEASALCRTILAADDRNAAAWQLLGRIAMQDGDYTGAVNAFSRSAGFADSAGINVELGNALLADGACNAAVGCYDRAIRLQTDHADAWYGRGNALGRLHRHVEALHSYDRAIAANPDDAEIWYARGQALHALGRRTDAIDSFDRAIARDPGHAHAYLDRGQTLAKCGCFGDAIDSQTQALAVNPDFPEALHARAVALSALGRPDEAVEDLTRALKFAPGDASVLASLGDALIRLRRPIEALGCFERLIERAPGTAQGHAGRSFALKMLNRTDEALIAAERAVAAAPAGPGALGALGVVFLVQNRQTEALDCFRRALQSRPDDATMLSNMSRALMELGRTREALEAHERGLAVYGVRDVPPSQLRANGSFCRLKLGQWQEAWRDYEERWHDRAVSVGWRAPDAPQWTGAEDLAGRTILLWGEQGLGDTLQFCRYARLVAAKGGQVVLLVPHGLARLLSRLAGVTRVIPFDDDVAAQPDYHAPLMSLPLAFGTTVETIPDDPYLTAEPGQVSLWRRRLRQRAPALRQVGLVWAGGERTDVDARAIDQRRSMDLSTFAPLSAIAGVAFVSLQKGEPALQARSAPGGLSLFDATHELDDFDDTAALVSALDLVIGVDTSVVHLAGGLGKPVWVLNRFDSCWRWLEDRTDSPWYPSARLFRQPSPGDWTSVIREVAAALADFVREGTAGGG
jgi:tetratricopeptide (TPR) repeat protein